MLVSFENGFAYLRPRKVASTSTEFILSKYCTGPHDIVGATGDVDRHRLREEHGLPGPKNHQLPLHKIRPRHIRQSIRKGRRRPELHNHTGGDELRHVIGRRFDKLLKISSTRDPYDRLVSLFHFRTEGLHPRPSFSDWFWANPHQHVRELRGTTQVNGSDCVDYYVRQETVKESILELCSYLNLPAPSDKLFSDLTIDRNPSDRDRNLGTQAYFDKRSMEFGQDAFRADFLRHGYNLIPS